MEKHSEVLLALDVAKRKHAVAIVEEGGRAKCGFSAMSRTAHCRSRR